MWAGRILAQCEHEAGRGAHRYQHKAAAHRLFLPLHRYRQARPVIGLDAAGGCPDETEHAGSTYPLQQGLPEQVAARETKQDLCSGRKSINDQMGIGRTHYRAMVHLRTRECRFLCRYHYRLRTRPPARVATRLRTVGAEEILAPCSLLQIERSSRSSLWHVMRSPP